MKIDITYKNPAMISLLEDKYQTIPLDANIIIAPDRSDMNRNSPFDFILYERAILKPLFLTFPYLAIHEAVYEELKIKTQIKTFIDNLISTNKLIYLEDSSLNSNEEIIRVSIENKIAKYTEYHPVHNSTDKGEVKTLAHVAAKNLLYFCSHDAKALRLVDDAEKLNTSLENVKTIKLYEIIFYILISGNLSKQQEKAFKALYKYQYTLTTYEKANNPEWGDFKNNLLSLYYKEIEIFKES